MHTPLYAAVIISFAELTPAKMLPTGGPDGASTIQEDWTDRYPGCGASIDAAQAYRSGSALDTPDCESNYEICYGKADGLEAQPRTQTLCGCLAAFKTCIHSLVPKMVTPTGDPMAPFGCPEVIYSRLCAIKEEDLTKGLSFSESNAWRCGACADPTGESTDACINALHEEKCFCHFDCPSDYSSSCDGYKCHSISCLVSLMRCWVNDYGCIPLAAWYICLHDSPASIKQADGTYGLTPRPLRCTLSACRNAIIHLENSNNEPYLWLAGFAAIFVFFSAFLIYTHKHGRQRILRRHRRLGLRP